MNRRKMLHTLAAAGLSGAISACGGGGSSSPAIESFTSDKSSYFVGDYVTLRAVYSGSSARIEPGAIPISSGATIRIGPLAGTARYRLVVNHQGMESLAELTVPVVYRNAFTPLVMGFARSSHIAIPGGDDRVYIIGGEGGGGAPPTAVMAFDAATGLFTHAGELATGRTHHCGALLQDGSILIAGGTRTTSGSPSTEIFHARSGQSRATMFQPLQNRSMHTASRLPDGRVLLAGGRSAGQSEASDTMDIFDPHTERFFRVPSRLNVARYAHAAALVTPRLLVLYGGVTLSGTAAAPEVIDLDTFSSTVLAMPPYDADPRIAPAVVRTSGGDTYVIGGEDYQGGVPFSQIVGLSAGGLAHHLAALMQEPRTTHAAAALADGRILITGGTTGLARTALATTEMFSPGSGRIIRGPDMLAARANHTATTLPDGRVLIAGGIDRFGNVIDSAELFG